MADHVGLQTLESLFDNHEFADLTVVAGGVKFMVHKNILCTASTWFRAACTKDFQEASTATVRLPEPVTVVKCLLLHLYGLDNKISDLIEGDFQVRMKLVARIHMAADKYDCSSLAAAIIKEANCQIDWHGDPHGKKLVQSTVWAYTQTEGRIDAQIHYHLARATAQCLHKIAEDDATWSLLASCGSYMSAVLRCVATCRGFHQLSDILRKDR